MRIGDKVVFGRNNTVNCYLDVEIGAATLVADWVYVTDFDHVTADVHRPIKDQGITKTPVRIGPECWLGVKTSVLRGTRIGARLLERIERLAAERGLDLLVLETGEAPGFQPAWRLYERAGYTVRGAFLDYPDSGYSRFYEKKLSK